jgi:hypothetical protein
MRQNSDGVIGRHGDGEKEIIILWVPESPFLRVFLCLLTIPIFQNSTIPIFRYSSYFSLFWNLSELRTIMSAPNMPNASIWGQRISKPFAFKKTPRMMTRK